MWIRVFFFLTSVSTCMVWWVIGNAFVGSYHVQHSSTFNQTKDLLLPSVCMGLTIRTRKGICWIPLVSPLLKHLKHCGLEHTGKWSRVEVIPGFTGKKLVENLCHYWKNNTTIQITCSSESQYFDKKKFLRCMCVLKLQKENSPFLACCPG